MTSDIRRNSISRRTVLQAGVSAGGFAMVGVAARATESSVVPAQVWRPTLNSSPAYDPRFDNARIEGICADRFQPVWAAMQYNLASGDDIGASVAVFVDGEPVVDIWGGYFDATFDRAWDRNTIITTHSITKTMTAMAALVLADSGELDFDAPVAKYWPEFAAAGKKSVLVRQLLGHTSGLAGWTADVSWDDVYDLEYSSALLAAQEPWWEPGTGAAYHAMNQGHLVNGVIQRITGMTLGKYFAAHVAGPLKADSHIGTGPEHDHRVSSFIQAVAEIMPHGTWIQERVGLNPNLTPLTSRAIEWRRAEVGAVNGHGNARSIATLHSALACGEANGIRLLSDNGRHRALQPQFNGVDQVLGVSTKWGMGFALECNLVPMPLQHRLAFWIGSGGLLGLADFDERMAVSYVTNRWVEGQFETARLARIIKAVYEGLGHGA